MTNAVAENVTRDDIINQEIEEEHQERKSRIVSVGMTTVKVLDEKGEGGANHKYVVISGEPVAENSTARVFANVEFQKGGVREHGINGCQNEDLIAIVIDRLQGFQSGQFSCRENAIALTKLEEALLWLNKRTADRVKRGVEGVAIQ